MSLTWHPNGLQIGAHGCSETRKLVNMRLKKHDKKTSKKNIEICSKMVHKEGPKKVIFCDFSGFHPSMVARASLGRLPGSEAYQNGGPDMDFLLFWDHAFTLFGDTLEYFLCSMNNKMIDIDVQFTVVFA